jgi:hypothetical protein
LARCASLALWLDRWPKMMPRTGRKNAVTSEAIANPSCSDGSLPPACGGCVVVVVLEMVIPYSIGEPGIISAR